MSNETFDNSVSIKEYISALFKSLTQKIDSTEKNLSNKFDMLEKNHEEKIETVKKDIYNIMSVQNEHTKRISDLEKNTSSSNGQKRLVKIAVPVILTIVSIIFGILAFARG